MKDNLSEMNNYLQCNEINNIVVDCASVICSCWPAYCRKVLFRVWKSKNLGVRVEIYGFSSFM